MHDSVSSARYSTVCNVLRLWSISLIPTYRVGTDSMIYRGDIYIPKFNVFRYNLRPIVTTLGGVNDLYTDTIYTYTPRHIGGFPLMSLIKAIQIKYLVSLL